MNKARVEARRLTNTTKQLLRLNNIVAKSKQRSQKLDELVAKSKQRSRQLDDMLIQAEAQSQSLKEITLILSTTLEESRIFLNKLIK